MKSKTRQILLHISGATAFLLLPVLFSPDFFRVENLFVIKPFLRDFLTYILLLLFFYLNYFFLLPRYYFNKKYFLLAICIIVCFLFVSSFPGFIFPGNGWISTMQSLHSPPHGEFHMPPPPSEQMEMHAPPQEFRRGFFGFGHHFFQFVIVLIFSTLLRTNNQWRQARKEKTDAELSYLKAQVNPHFLFNTLNSIYASAIAERASKTSTAIVELSGMMRYVITEADHDIVSLSKELKYIGNYIELQKMRLGDTAQIEFICDGTAEGKEIAPLLLIPFIENAFKHGVNPEEKSLIKINLSIKSDELYLMVFNNKFSSLHEGEPRSGLGIENTKQRLDLLYPGRHNLKIQDDANDFSITLIIQFA